VPPSPIQGAFWFGKIEDKTDSEEDTYLVSPDHTLPEQHQNLELSADHS
jgi:hypothetical protein